MFSHVFVGVGDFERAMAFYGPLMAALGIAPRFCQRDRPWARWQSSPGPRPLFLIGAPHDQLAHGGSCAGAPGLRPEYHAHYYGAYFRDPDGNKLCVACHVAPA